MSDHEKDKQLDEMLDTLLATYSSAEPRPGLETRILAQVRDAENREESPLWSLKWVWAGAALAAAILLLTLWTGSRHSTAPAGNSMVRIEPAVPTQQQVQESVPAMSKAAPRHRQKTHAAQGLENTSLALNQRPAVFPTPTPLSEQEQLLLRYFTRTPREELIAQSHADEPPVIGDDESNVVLPDLVSVPQKSSNTR